MSVKIYDTTGKQIELSEIKKLSDIADIDPAAPTADQVLAWNAVLEKWKAADAAGGVATLNDVGDVEVPSPGDGNVLYWDNASTKWKFKEALAEHGADKHTNVTRYLFIPAADAPVGDGTAIAEGTANVPVLQVASDAEKTVLLSYFRCPDDFVSFTNMKLLWYAVNSGNMYWCLEAAYGAAGELMTHHQENPGYGATTGTGEGKTDLQEPSNPLSMSNLAKEDFVAIRYKRDGTHADDTIGSTGEVELLGLLMEYTAEQ